MKWIAGFLSVGLLFGCAHGKMGVVDQALPKGAITKKTPIFVDTIDAKHAEFTGDKSADSLKVSQEKREIEARYGRMIADALRKKGYEAQAMTPKSQGIVITGKVRKFEHGSAAARMFVGMGAGSSNIFTDIAIEDRTAKKTLARFEVIATSGGRGGASAMGSFIEAHLTDGAEQVAKYVDENSK